ncbi:MAG: sarcosine oxidase subunit beta [Rhodospirillaceae bacterium]|nr:sarcosine oxidase subunit beta [Rhodospirillaceae bacterium]
MTRYSALNLFQKSRDGHKGWPEAWRKPAPKSSYDIVIVGGGGHGLATAYYLAKNYGINNIAVLEKGWIGGGNTGRNTTIIRSNYLWNESAHLYELSLKLYEKLSQELNFNIMLSQRGVINLAHSQSEMHEVTRRVSAIRLNGIDSEVLTPDQIKSLIPIINLSSKSRYPILGGSIQRRGGVARHDAVAWGFARAADNLGIDIIENCEVLSVSTSNGIVRSLETTRGCIGAKKFGFVVSGHSSVLAEKAGFRLPICSQPLQALVSEPLKPFFDVVLMSGTVHVYLSQSDKGELVLGAGTDKYNSYSQRGSLSVIEEMMSASLELFPILSRLKVMRMWGRIVDICPDASPIIGNTPLRNLYINCGWGTGGFKATPGSGYVFAHNIATGEPHNLAAPFSLDRFAKGKLIDEHGAAAVAH